MYIINNYNYLYMCYIIFIIGSKNISFINNKNTLARDFYSEKRPFYRAPSDTVGFR